MRFPLAALVLLSCESLTAQLEGVTPTDTGIDVTVRTNIAAKIEVDTLPGRTAAAADRATVVSISNSDLEKLPQPVVLFARAGSQFVVLKIEADKLPKTGEPDAAASSTGLELEGAHGSIDLPLEGSSAVLVFHLGAGQQLEVDGANVEAAPDGEARALVPLLPRVKDAVSWGKETGAQPLGTVRVRTMGKGPATDHAYPLKVGGEALTALRREYFALATTRGYPGTKRGGTQISFQVPLKRGPDKGFVIDPAGPIGLGELDVLVERKETRRAGPACGKYTNRETGEVVDVARYAIDTEVLLHETATGKVLASKKYPGALSVCPAHLTSPDTAPPTVGGFADEKALQAWVKAQLGGR